MVIIDARSSEYFQGRIDQTRDDLVQAKKGRNRAGGIALAGVASEFLFGVGFAASIAHHAIAESAVNMGDSTLMLASLTIVPLITIVAGTRWGMLFSRAENKKDDLQTFLAQQKVTLLEEAERAKEIEELKKFEETAAQEAAGGQPVSSPNTYTSLEDFLAGINRQHSLYQQADDSVQIESLTPSTDDLPPLSLA